MTKKTLIDYLIETKRYSNRKEATHAINSIFSSLREALISGEQCTFSGLFSMQPCVKKEATYKDPITKQPRKVPAHAYIKVTMSQKLKNELLFYQEEEKSEAEDKE